MKNFNMWFYITKTHKEFKLTYKLPTSQEIKSWLYNIIKKKEKKDV